MSDKQPYAALLDRLKPLWVFLTGGAFVTLVGGALTYIYFWRIGGIPIGQTGGTGAIIKVVVSSAALLGGALFLCWLAPTIIFLLFADDEKFQERIGPWFSGAPSTVSGDKKEPVDLRAIAAYAGSTVGIASLGLTLAMSMLGWGLTKNWSRADWFLYTAAVAILIGLALCWMWKRIHHGAGELYGADKNNLIWGIRAEGLLSWLWRGYSAAVVSLIPVLILLEFFLKSDYLLKLDSVVFLTVGTFLISMGVLASYGVSLAVLLRLKKGFFVKWLIVLAFNTGALVAVVLILGMPSRMLESVMRLSSLRVENAVMLLEPEGCAILQSMQARGWEWEDETSKKSCVLYDVTIQSTLAPAMQVACWRGVVAPEPAPQLANAEQVMESATRNVQVAGRQGAFTIPTQYVRSIWKTAGLKPKEQAFVCPPTLSLHSRLTPAASE